MKSEELSKILEISGVLWEFLMQVNRIYYDILSIIVKAGFEASRFIYFTYYEFRDDFD
jgi:hypothetical protein